MNEQRPDPEQLKVDPDQVVHKPATKCRHCKEREVMARGYCSPGCEIGYLEGLLTRFMNKTKVYQRVYRGDTELMKIRKDTERALMTDKERAERLANKAERE